MIHNQDDRIIQKFNLDSMSKRSPGRIELCEDLADWNGAGDAIAINATANFFAFQVVNPKHRIAAPVFIETFVLRCVTERIDEHRHEVGRSRDNFVINKRTACKASTTRSARVFTEMQPHRSIGAFRVGKRIFVIHVPVYRSDANRLSIGGKRRRCAGHGKFTGI